MSAEPARERAHPGAGQLRWPLAAVPDSAPRRWARLCSCTTAPLASGGVGASLGAPLSDPNQPAASAPRSAWRVYRSFARFLVPYARWFAIAYLARAFSRRELGLMWESLELRRIDEAAGPIL